MKTNQKTLSKEIKETKDPVYCKQCCNEHWGTRVSFNSGFLGFYAQQWDCWIVWQFYFQFFKEIPHCSRYWCSSLHSHQQCKKVRFAPHPFQQFIVCRLFDSSHSDQVVLICIYLIMSGVEHLVMVC